jgi:lysyl-tRNA synthetase class 2
MHWLDSLRAKNINPYPHKFHRDLRIDQYVEKYGPCKGCSVNGEFMPEVIALTGRVKFIRSAGKKLLFIDLFGDDAKVQIMATQQFYTDENWEALSTIRRGDIIGVAGNPGRTNKGELSMRPTSIT